MACLRRAMLAAATFGVAVAAKLADTASPPEPANTGLKKRLRSSGPTPETGTETGTKKLKPDGGTKAANLGRPPTPTSWIAMVHMPAMLRNFLARDGSLVNSRRENRTLLGTATERTRTAEIFDMLLTVDGIDVNAKEGKFGYTPLHWALSVRNNMALEKLLAAKNIDVNAKSDYGETPLFFAVAYNEGKAMRALLEAKGINVNAATNSGYTALHAAASGNDWAFELLLGVTGIDVNVKDNRGRTPLHVAVELGEHDMVTKLLAVRDTDVNVQDLNGEAPLHTAVRGNNYEVMEALLGAEWIVVNVVSNWGKTPRDLARNTLADATLFHNGGVFGRSLRCRDRYHFLVTREKDVFDQALKKLYIPSTGGVQADFSVVFVSNGKQEAGIDAGGPRREFVSLLAEGMQADVLKDLYGDDVWRLVPVTFYNGVEGTFNAVPLLDEDRKARLRFFGAALAQFFVLDRTASTNFLLFPMDPRIYLALAEGAVSRPERSGKPGALEDCEAVAALLHPDDKDSDSGLGRLGPYKYRGDGSGSVYVGVARGAGFETAEEFDRVLVGACARFWSDGWAAPMRLVLAGWTAQLGQRRAAELQGERTPGAFAAWLREQIERPGPVDLQHLAAKIDVTGSAAQGRQQQLTGTFLDALEHFRAKRGDGDLRRLLAWWTGSKSVDAKPKGKYLLHVQEETELEEWQKHVVRANTCGFALYIPKGFFDDPLKLVGKLVDSMNSDPGFGNN